MKSGELWCKLMRGESVTIEEAALALYGVDASHYIQTVYDKQPRYRSRVVSCDGTALLTLSTLSEMILPIVNCTVYDKQNGEPSGSELGIKYKCTPIKYTRNMKQGCLGGYKGLVQEDSFYITYSSEFIYGEDGL